MLAAVTAENRSRCRVVLGRSADFINGKSSDPAHSRLPACGHLTSLSSHFVTNQKPLRPKRDSPLAAPPHASQTCCRADVTSNARAAALSAGRSQVGEPWSKKRPVVSERRTSGGGWKGSGASGAGAISWRTHSWDHARPDRIVSPGAKAKLDPATRVSGQCSRVCNECALCS